MGWFSKLASGASNLFNKVENGASNLFNKVKDATPGILDQVSYISGKIAGGLDKASDIGGKILSSPITQGLAASFGPEGEAALMGANALLNGVQQGANIAHKVSNITNQGSYSGNSQDIQNDVLQRGKNLYGALKAPPPIQYQ